MEHPFVLLPLELSHLNSNQMPTLSESLFQVQKAFWKDSLSGQRLSQLEEGWQGEDEGEG